MAALAPPRPTGDLRTSYRADMTLFPTRGSLLAVVAGVALLAGAPGFLSPYGLSLLILIGIYGVAALGLNVLVGASGQVSLGQGAFFGLGAFSSAFIHEKTGVPVLLAMPLAGLLTTAVGMVFGIPAARIRGIHLAIATLAAQFVLQDFFSRATWFTGGSSGAPAATASFFGLPLGTDARYFYLVLFWVIVSFVGVANLMRTRDGRAMVALRDHHLAAEIMGIHLSRYRILAFGIGSFFAGIAGALYGHYLNFVSVEAFTVLLSVQFLGMIIIGGLGSVMGTLLGVTFLVLLPEAMEAVVGAVTLTAWGNVPAIARGLPFFKQMGVGAAIVLFLMFEPDGLAHRWKRVKAYWKLYPFSY